MVSSLSEPPQIVIILPQPTPGSQCSSEHLEFANALWIILEGRHPLRNSVQIRQIHEIETTISSEILYIVLEDMSQPLLGRPINAAAFTQIRTLVTSASKVLWASIAHDAAAVENPETALIAGVLRSAREEHNRKELVVFTMQTPPLQNDPNDVIERLVDVCNAAFLSNSGFHSGQIENEWAYSHGQLFVPRLLVNETVDDVLRSIVVEPPLEVGHFHQPDRPVKLEIVSPGVLETIRYVDDDSVDPLEIDPDMVEIKTAAFGLNPKDMIILMGQNRRAGLSYTGECAGIVTAVGTKWKDTLKAGDRVCAWASSIPFPSRVRVSGHHAWQIPDHMSLEEASTIPVAWGTAWKALIGIANMRPGHSLLIHAAAGAVGQAVIQVARNVLGVTEIYATCSSAKRAFLVEELGIPESHIFNSRSSSFKRAILRVTGGRGVDVVINSLKGDLLRESLDCVAQLGTFIEIGKDDILSKALVALEPLDRGITISAFDLTDLAMLRPQETHDMIQDVLNCFGRPGRSSKVSHIKPLAFFDLSQLDEALRIMRTGHHTGKLVITANEATKVHQIPRGTPLPKLNGRGVHLIPGGTGGIGRVIGRWMLERGAKRVALLSRHDANAETKAELEQESQHFGAEIKVVRCDVSVESDVAALAEMYHQQGVPVRGIVHSAAALHDAELADMTVDEFEGAVKPKVDGTRFVLKYFDTADLDYILLLSSAAGILGPRGASNYAAANAYMDMLSYTYHTKRAHLVVLNLGPVKEAGIVARNRRLYDVFMTQGFVEVTNKEIRRLLDYSCGPAAQRDQCHQIITSLSRDAFEASNPVALNRPLLRLLPSAKLRDISTNEEHAQREDTQLSIREVLSSAIHPDQAVEMVIPAMVAKIAALTGVDATSLEEDHPLESIGMDSLIVIDLKNWIQREFGVSMQPSEIMEALGVSILANTLVNKSPFLRIVAPTASTSIEKQVTSSSETASRVVSSERDDGDQNEVQSQASSLGDSGVEIYTPFRPKSEHGRILDQILDEFLLSASCVSQSEEELAQTERRVRAVREAVARGQFGPLHALEQQAQALEAEGFNWITHFSLGLPFLEIRSPLVPSQNVFAVHPIRIGVTPTAIERATTLALAACRCLESIIQDGSDTNARTGGLAVPRLFNSVRLPGATMDQAVKHHFQKFFVVFYHGHAFKVSIPLDTTWTNLNALLTDVAHLGDTLDQDGSGVAALTTAARPVWAEVRERIVRLDEMNVTYLDTIEKATFILCIDTEDFSLPMTPHELSMKIFLGDGHNRWQDKGLQLVACSNGISGHIIEHSLGDDRSSEPLAKLMGKGIFEEEEALILESRKNKALNHVQEKPSLLEVRLDSAVVEEARRALDDLFQRAKACVVEVRTLPALKDDKKWTVDLVQLVLHLAALRFFGSHFSSVESVQGFHRGLNARATIADTTLPEVWAFCDSMCPSLSSSQQVTTGSSSKLLSDALGALRNRRADKLAFGISWNWYLPSLRRAFAAAGDNGSDVTSGNAGLNELESLLDDPVHRRCLVPRLWANRFQTAATASGNWLEAKGTVRTRYDFGDDGTVKFHLFANDSDVDAFWLEIEKAARDVESCYRSF